MTKRKQWIVWALRMGHRMYATIEKTNNWMSDPQTPHYTEDRSKAYKFKRKRDAQFIAGFHRMNLEEA
jgi:hypothetical protein